MASTYSPDLRIELIGTGEQQGTWGQTTNKNLGTLIEAAIAGGISQNITGLTTYTLTVVDGLPDQARAAFLRFTGTLTGTCDIVAPSVSKSYIIRNDTTGGYPIQIKTATGAVIIVPAGESSIVECNGLDFYSALTCINDDARITGDLTVDGALSAGSFTLASPLPVLSGGTGVTTSTGTTNVVLSNSPTLVSPNLDTPTVLVGTNITGTAAGLTAGTVTTNANLTGMVTSVGNATTVVTNAPLTGAVTSAGNVTTVITNANLTGEATSVGNATTLTNSAVIGKVLTGYVSAPGTVAATDTILQAFNKIGAGGSSNPSITNDTTTNAVMYPTWVTGITGALPVYVSSTRLNFNPSLGKLTVNGVEIGLGGGGVTSNTAVGVTALNANTTGIQNTAVGYQALTTNTVGTGNTAVGYQSLRLNTGINNTAVGQGALTANTSSSITAVGYAALQANTTGTNNTAVGYQALLSNISGNFNTAVGNSALSTNTIGTNNVAVGYAALNANTTGTSNTAVGMQALSANKATGGTAVGFQALYLNETGIQNTAVGNQALTTNTVGANNTAVGYQSLRFNTTGINNTAVGVQALAANTTGVQNTAMGVSALQANTIGTDNSAVGYAALQSNTTGILNTAMGVSALQANTIGTNNVAVGNQALTSNTTGVLNTAVGSQALQLNTIGTNNVAVGYAALNANTTGVQNTALGFAALAVNTIGAQNTAIGTNAGVVLTSGGTNTIAGYNTGLLLTTGSSNQVFGDSITLAAAATGRIAIGRNFTQGVDDSVIIGNGTARISCPYTVSATWTFSSDERIKNVIGKDTLGLDFINDLEPVTYRWKPSNEVPKELTSRYAEENVQDTNIVMHGLIAQNVKAALDKAGVDTFTGWSVDIDGTQRLGMADLITPLINAIKELDAKFEAYKASHP